MKLQQLRYLAAVVETGSVTAAAQRLNVSQPALSAGLAALEAELGGPLLERRRANVRLTPRGARFHRRALGILGESEAAKAEFKRGSERAPVAVGVLPTIGTALIARFARRFAEVAPGLDLALREADGRTLLSWLSNGRIEAALTISDMAEGDGWTPLFHDRLALVCAKRHRLAAVPQVRLGDLEDEPFVMREHCERGREAWEVLAARGIRLRVVLRTGQERRALDLVAAGIGVTIAPESLVAESGAAVAMVPIEDLGLTRTVGCQLPASLDEAVARALLAAVEGLGPERASEGACPARE